MTEPNWDLLIVGGTILTMEPDTDPITDGAIAVADGRIAAVGLAENLLEHAPTGEVVNAAGCIVMPGMVNTHAHLAMTLLRGLADDLHLMDWLENHIWPAEKNHMNRETTRLGTELAVAEQLLAGVTTTTDMYFFGDQVAAILAKAGMRGVIAESLIDSATPRCATPEDMMVKQRELAEEYRDHPLITPSIAAHSPYSVCAANLVKEAELAEEYGLTMQIHLSETRWEVEKLLEEKGRTPVAYLAELGVLSERTVAAHCGHVSPEDIHLLVEFEVGVAHDLPLGVAEKRLERAVAARVDAVGVLEEDQVGDGVDDASQQRRLMRHLTRRQHAPGQVAAGAVHAAVRQAHGVDLHRDIPPVPVPQLQLHPCAAALQYLAERCQRLLQRGP